jgi:hypothetical protein
LRRLVTIGSAAVVCIGVPVGVANPAVTSSGRLTGKTEISFGCPGPVREGTPGCNPRRRFVHARFSLAQRSASGNPIPGTAAPSPPTRTGSFSFSCAAPVPTSSRRCRSDTPTAATALTFRCAPANPQQC